jgi:hypothetical protein
LDGPVDICMSLTNKYRFYCQVSVLLWRVLFYYATQTKGKPERLGFFNNCDRCFPFPGRRLWTQKSPVLWPTWAGTCRPRGWQFYLCTSQNVIPLRFKSKNKIRRWLNFLSGYGHVCIITKMFYEYYSLWDRFFRVNNSASVAMSVTQQRKWKHFSFTGTRL